MCTRATGVSGFFLKIESEVLLRDVALLLWVLDSILSQEEYLATDYSIADIACWPWVQNVANIGLKLADFASIWRWSELIKARPAVITATQSKAMQVPAAYLNKRMTLTANQWNNLFGY